MSTSDQDSALEAASDHASTADDNDSTFGDEDSGYWGHETSTRSVTASVYDYERLHGRSYHSFHAGKYVFPNDEAEQDRIDIMYHGFRLAVRDTLFFAPITEPQAILDIGTGTGIWAMDVADAYPEAIVIGTDLSPIQPQFVPPNLTFEISDADDEWTFRPKFDMVHTRFMHDITLRSWPHFFAESFRCLKPGGWVECQEFDYNRRSDDDTIRPDSRVKFWEQEWTRGVERLGMRGFCVPEVAMEQMRQAGFVNVSCRRFKLPIGPWPKDPQLREAGLFGLVNILDGIQGLSLKVFTQLLGYSVPELETLMMECRREIKDKSVHSYWPLFIILGQKPDADAMEL